MKAVVLLVLGIFATVTVAATATFYASKGYLPLSITEIILFIF